MKINIKSELTHQYAVLNKVKAAIILSVKYPQEKYSGEKLKTLSKEEIAEIQYEDILKEALKMLIINYTIVLVGNKRNDKISIFNTCKDGEKEEIDKFYGENEDLINRMYEWRNKYYSHMDMNFPEVLKKVPFYEIKECIKFADKIINRRMQQGK